MEPQDITEQVVHVVTDNGCEAQITCDFPATNHANTLRLGRALAEEYWADHEGAGVIITFADGREYTRGDFRRLQGWR